MIRPADRLICFVFVDTTVSSQVGRGGCDLRGEATQLVGPGRLVEADSGLPKAASAKGGLGPLGFWFGHVCR